MATLGIRKNDQIELLRGVKLFSACSKAELGRIASLTTEHQATAGQVLMERGEPGLQFFVIVKGRATATRNGVQIAELGPGSFFGELALLDGRERTATVVAKTAMHLLVLSRREFISLNSAAPSVANKMLVELGSRLRLADDLFDAAPGLDAKAIPWSV